MARSAYLRILLNGCVKSGGLFVAFPSFESCEFDGVALWGSPCDDLLPWYAFCIPYLPSFVKFISSRLGNRKNFCLS